MQHALINAYVDSVRPVSSQLVEEVAREFQLDEIARIAPWVFRARKQTANTQALLENLDELLGRLRQANAGSIRARGNHESH